MVSRPTIAALDVLVSQKVRKGRGAVSNRGSRFDAHDHVRIDDGWSDPAQAGDACDAFRNESATRIIVDRSKTIIARNRSPDVPFDRSINPYRGCEHGCVYCFARPTHAYLGLSPGLDFETVIHVKPNAPRLLEQALAKPAYRCRAMAMGTNTDPYQPLEREHRITRQLLEVLSAHAHPVGFVTKSALITRDMDILSPMAARGLTHAYISITTLDNALCAKLEPRAAAPHKRLATVRTLADAGIPVGVLVAPVIPFVTDAEVERIAAAAIEAGASAIGYVLLRLPLEIEVLVEEWLQAHVPLKAKRVMSLMRSMRGGKAYDSRWGWRQRGTGAYADTIAHRFNVVRKRHGIGRSLPPLDIHQFTRPAVRIATAAADTGGVDSGSEKPTAGEKSASNRCAGGQQLRLF
jgi:DNA repair photolyase